MRAQASKGRFEEKSSTRVEKKLEQKGDGKRRNLKIRKGKQKC